MDDFFSENQKKTLRELAQKYDFSLLVLFGSQASGKTHRESDVDLAFLGRKRFAPHEVAKMQNDFAGKLGIEKLEMVDLKSASPLLMRQAAEKSVLLFEDEASAFSRFKIYAQKIFMESKKLLEIRNLSLQKFLGKI